MLLLFASPYIFRKSAKNNGVKTSPNGAIHKEDNIAQKSLAIDNIINMSRKHNAATEWLKSYETPSKYTIEEQEMFQRNLNKNFLITGRIADIFRINGKYYVSIANDEIYNDEVFIIETPEAEISKIRERYSRPEGMFQRITLITRPIKIQTRIYPKEDVTIYSEEEAEIFYTIDASFIIHCEYVDSYMLPNNKYNPISNDDIIQRFKNL
jgi:hypothetical protein